MVAVFDCAHGGVVVVSVLADQKVRTVGQDNIVLGETFFHSRW